MRRLSVVILTVISLLLLAVAVPAEINEEWDIAGVTKISINGVSGDVEIVPVTSGKPVLKLSADVKPGKSFNPIVKKSGSTLKIKEKWSNNSSGEVKWTLFLPTDDEAVTVNISNASGDLTCSDVSVHIDYKTASGDIELSNVNLDDGSEFSTASGDYTLEDMTVRSDSEFSTASGDFELDNLTIESDCEFSTASGDIDIKGCTCGDDVEFSSASGDVSVRASTLTGEGEFSSASGDVAVQIAELPEEGLSASSASGDVTLDVDSYSDDFTLIITKRKNKGKIRCPFDFTDEEEFKRDRYTYVRKTVKRGSGVPVIELSTASGSVVVKK